MAGDAGLEGTTVSISSSPIVSKPLSPSKVVKSPGQKRIAVLETLKRFVFSVECEAIAL